MSVHRESSRLDHPVVSDANAAPLDVSPRTPAGDEIDSNVFVTLLDRYGGRRASARYRPSHRVFRIDQSSPTDTDLIEITAAGYETAVVEVPAGDARRDTVAVRMQPRHNTLLLMDVGPQLDTFRRLAQRAFADPRVARALAGGRWVGSIDDLSIDVPNAELSRETRLLAALVADEATIRALVEPDATTVCPPGTVELVRRQLSETWVIPADDWLGLSSVFEARCRFYAIADAVLRVPAVVAMTPPITLEDQQIQLSRVLASADFPGLDVIVSLVTRAESPSLVAIDAFGRGLMRTLPVQVPEGYFARRHGSNPYPSTPDDDRRGSFLSDASSELRRIDDPERASFSLASLAALLDDALSSVAPEAQS